MSKTTSRCDGLGVLARLGDRHGPHVDGIVTLVGHHRRASSSIGRAAPSRRGSRRSTNAISTSAAPQACSCRAGSGCSEYVKIRTGMFGSAFVTSVETAGEDRAGEEQRRRLAGGARDRQHRAGEDAAEARRQDDAEHGAPAADAEREARLPQRGRHEQQHLLRRARDQRQHDDRERERARIGALRVPDDEQRRRRRCR